MNLLLLFVLILPLSLEPRAASCVCVKEPNPSEAKTKADRRQAFDESVAVFTGEVIALDSFTVKIKLHKRWKGDDAREAILSTGAVPGHDGTPLPKECSYEFRLGEQYLVYAYRMAEKLMANTCSAFPIREAAAEEKGLDEIKGHEIVNQSSAGAPRHFPGEAKSNNGMHPTANSAAYIRETCV